MILAFHCIFGAYGFWLPNEPRGSWSTFVANWELYQYGKATTTDSRQSVAATPYDKAKKQEMLDALEHPPVTFTGEQAQILGKALPRVGYDVFALAVMPEHVHLVVGWSPRPIRRMVGHIKGMGTRALREEGHFADRTPWGEHGWNVYLNTDESAEKAIKYVESNPLRARLKPQRWSGVVGYESRQ